MYHREPTYTAVVHVHAPNATSLSCLAPWSPLSALPPITPYFVMRVGQTPLIPYRHPGDPELGSLIESQPGRFRAALLANHGLVAAGPSLAAALAVTIELEEACRITLITMEHSPHLLQSAAIRDLTERYGTSWDEQVPAGLDGTD
jgi:L-fuculose-phosphate aldolase